MLTKGKYNFRAIILGGIVSRYSFEEFLFFEFQDNFVCTALEFFNLEIVQEIRSYFKILQIICN